VTLSNDRPVALSAAGRAMLMRFEGLRLVAYTPVAGDVPTIGWGATRYADGRPVRLGDRCSRADADALLAATVARDATALVALLGDTATTQAQFDALLCLGYNIGMHALAGSTLLAAHRAGQPAAAAGHFADWRFAGGHAVAGLTARRAAEAFLYRGQS